MDRFDFVCPLRAGGHGNKNGGRIELAQFGFGATECDVYGLRLGTGHDIAGIAHHRHRKGLEIADLRTDREVNHDRNGKGEQLPRPVAQEDQPQNVANINGLHVHASSCWRDARTGSIGGSVRS